MAYHWAIAQSLSCAHFLIIQAYFQGLYLISRARSLKIYSTHLGGNFLWKMRYGQREPNYVNDRGSYHNRFVQYFYFIIAHLLWPNGSGRGHRLWAKCLHPDQTLHGLVRGVQHDNVQNLCLLLLSYFSLSFAVCAQFNLESFFVDFTRRSLSIGIPSLHLRSLLSLGDWKSPCLIMQPIGKTTIQG